MIKKNHSKGMVLVMVSVLISSCAQLFMRMGMLAFHDVNITLSLAYNINISGLLFPALAWVSGGLISYCIAVLFWMRALAQYELSFAYPLMSLSYALVYIGAAYLPRLNETVSLTRSAGIVLIFIGVLIVARTSPAPQRGHDRNT